MKEDNDILKTIGRSDGMTVPDGYFADFAERMAGQLPQRPELAAMNVVAPPASLWGKLRPYVSMAAMFAGVVHAQDFHDCVRSAAACAHG